jgi:hypothetical protein
MANKVHFFVGLNRIALTEIEAAQYMPEFKAPKNWTDPVKIAAEVEKKRNDWLAGLDSNPITSLIQEICIKAVLETNYGVKPDFKELPVVFNWKNNAPVSISSALVEFFTNVHLSLTDKDEPVEVMWYGVEPSFYRELIRTSFVRDEICVKNLGVATVLLMFVNRARSYKLDELLGVEAGYVSKDKAYADHKARWGHPKLNLNSPANMVEFVRWCFALHGIVPKT